MQLFYNKRSQFVSGVEAEKISVCVGLKVRFIESFASLLCRLLANEQQPINDRIKELDFQDCKVRVTNVDSQGSDQNIVIQVIGEISNNSAPHRKFVQTFVLAGQTNGYFVLNDIFRYIADEEEMEDENLQPEQVRPQDRKGFKEPPPTAAGEAKQATLTSSNDPDAVEQDASKVDEQLTNVIKDGHKQQEQNAVKPSAAESAEKSNDAVPASEGNLTSSSNNKSTIADPVPDVNQPRESGQADSRKEADIEKINVSETKLSVEATPNSTDPSKPAAPKTWATLAAAANRVATPAVSVPASTPVAQPQARAGSNANPPSTSNAPSNNGISATDTAATNNASNPSSGWHTAGAEHNKRQSRAIPQQQSSSQQGNTDALMTRAYIKNVYESVDADELKATLSKYGELAYFDVNRMKVSTRFSLAQ